MMDHDDIQNPYPIYADMAQQGDIFWHKKRRAWCVLGYDAVRDILTDANFHVDISHVLKETTYPRKARPDIKPLTDYFKQWPVYLNPPEHTEVRREFNHLFTRKATEDYTPEIEVIVNDVCGKLSGEFDFVEDVASKIPPRVIAHVLGLPQNDAPKLLRWTSQLAGYFDAFMRTKDEYQPALTAVNEMQQYFKSDWITTSMILTAGIETTMSALASAVYTFINYPDQYALLKRQPELLDQAVEELLRMQPPLQRVGRQVKEDMRFHDCDLKSGEMVSVYLAAANYDARVFTSPNQFDISREKNPHLSFGFGIHYCLGRLLGRATLKTFIEYMLAHWPEMKLIDNSAQWKMGLSLRRLESLRISID